MTKRDATHFTMTATKNGQTLTLVFDSDETRTDAKIELRHLGFDVDAPAGGHVTHRSVESAVESARAFCRA